MSVLRIILNCTMMACIFLFGISMVATAIISEVAELRPLHLVGAMLCFGVSLILFNQTCEETK